MTDETAKALSEAMNRLAAAIERLPVGLGGISVQHQHLAGSSHQQPHWQGGNYPINQNWS